MKLQCFLAFLVFGFSKCASFSSITDSKNGDFLNDFTFDAQNSCADQIIYIQKSGQGILHSPNYFSNTRNKQTNRIKQDIKCKWTLVPPFGHKLYLTFLDLNNNNDCTSKLSISTVGSLKNNLYMELIDSYNKTRFKYRFENSRIDSCDDLIALKKFTTLESDNSSMIIEFNASNLNKNSLKFLVLFNSSISSSSFSSINKETCMSDLKLNCKSEYKIAMGSNKSADSYKHSTCLPRNYLSSCSVESLNKSMLFSYTDLAQKYANYIGTNSRLDSDCDYLHKLNEICRSNNVEKEIYNQNEDYNEYDEYEQASSVATVLQEKKKQNKLMIIQSVASECTNVTVSSEYGWIASPGFSIGKSYASALNCYYRIVLQPNQLVQIRFKQFNLRAAVSDSLLNQTQRRRNTVLENALDINELNAFLRHSNRNNREKDYDYLNIYDGATRDAPLIAHLTASNNDFSRYFSAQTFNSHSNYLLLVFHSASEEGAKLPPAQYVQHGFNLTYQIKGYCIEDQQACNSLYELNCYTPNQTCNDVWDCHNGADERGCRNCKPDQFSCRNHVFCYRMEDRCDGDHLCTDKSDEANCDAWFCNSANGTFLCNNGRCVYEQWVCDGTNDCDDGSDEINCPTPFTRRVITTAVLGGTLCCLLLVMALGCACKLYTLHTVGYRNNIRLSQTVQSAAAVAAAAASAPLLSSVSNAVPSVATNDSIAITSEPSSNSSFLSNLFSRRGVVATETSLPATAAPSASTQSQTGVEQSNTVLPTELPMPVHLIAPPTYNQTMGLVDEYEQRQLAFIEHVRSILAQQQQQQQQQQQSSSSTSSGNNSSLLNPLTSLNLIPTVTSGSTTVHRVSNSGRRSHSSRNHRSHHHHRSSSSNLIIDANSNATSNELNSNNNNISVAVSSRNRTHRHHHHHHRHQNYLQSSHSRNATGTGSGSFSSTSSSSSSNNAGTVSNNLTQMNFDANRRGLQQSLEEQQNRLSLSLVPPPRSFNQTNAPATNYFPLLPTNNTNQPETSTNDENKFITSGALGAQQQQQQSGQAGSINIRDRIAKLIKDIVVHHGDNIQYVQLADQANSTSNAIGQRQADTDSTTAANTSIMSSSSVSSNQNSGGNSEDDVPLIQP